ELLQACDIVLVADDVRLADNHSNFAMVPGGGGSQRLPRLIGRQRALAHILTGERIGAAEAVALGLAYRAVPAADLDAAADALAATLAAKDRAALARTKALVHDGLALPLDDALALERRTVVEHLTSAGAMDAFARKG
ncbi:enoyl-CoA hydratase/isomerase family protein, partial [Paraconexibacter sp.]|uniref:enoyl-CoA hydratase/isomerase family protein n=1 Tax=Paraconexibacter sp. TaxID=2949640 RepID=UPI00356314E3